MQKRFIADVSKDEIRSLQPVISTKDTLLDTPATAAIVTGARAMLGISQKALAIEMGVSQPYLCDLELSRRRWSLDLFNKAKSALERLSS